MAARRTRVGLRRRGPGLARQPGRLAPRAGLALALAALLAGCGGSAEARQRLTVHRENARHFLTRGAYPQAIHQAERALEIDPDSASDRLIRAVSLLRLGRSADRIELLEASLEAFDELAQEHDPDELSEAWVGLGSARFALALAYDRRERALTQQRDPDSATAASERARMAEARPRLLRGAEQALKAVLELEHQAENRDALVELLLVLSSQTGRDDEVLELGPRALALMEESTRFTRDILRRNLSLSPEARLRHQARIDTNLERERLIRDHLVTVRYNRGDLQGALAELAILEDRDLMGEVQYFNRARIHEQLGHVKEAVADLERFLRLRARRLDYAEDDMAHEVFTRLEQLRARSTTGPRR